MRGRKPLKRLVGLIAGAGVALACTPAMAVAQQPQTKIVSGSNATIEDYPYQVILRSRGSFICGGSILDATTVVTAGHCVTAQARSQITHTVYPASRFTIGYGSADQDSGTLVQVSSVSVPAAYQAPVASADESYDVAILRLATPIPFGPTAAPIPLAAAAQPKDSGTAFATGWGATTEGGSDSQNLQGVELPLRSDSMCAGTYGGDYVASRSVCAGGESNLFNNHDTCQGDSGGPLAVEVAGQWQLLGITSYGNGCGRRNTPGVYTWAQGTNIEPFISSRGADDRSLVAPTPVVTPAPAAPVAQPAPRDVTRPTLRYSKFSCAKKRRCTVRLRAADNLGAVAKLSVTVSRKVKSCKRVKGRKRCRTVTRKKTLKPKRVSGGFTATATFARATYSLAAVGTDRSGNRSKTLRRTLRVKR